MVLITIISLLLTVASAKAAENTCVSLANSKTCSAFSQFYISLPGLAYDYPFLINTTTIEEFDAHLLEYANSTSDYLFPLGCLSSNYNPTIPYARYSLTRLCVGMLQNPSYSLPCNFNHGLNPPPLCQSTCFDWVDSITHITQNPRVCSDSPQRNTSIASFSNQCSTWEGYNGTITDNCISGIANEPYFCGFGSNTRAACTYCRDHVNDECCQQVKYCKHSLSAGAIAGIVIGCLIGAMLILFAIIWCYCRKRRYPFVQFLASSNTSTTIASQHQPTHGTLGGGITSNGSSSKSTPFVNDKMMEIVDEPTRLQSTTDSTANQALLNEEIFAVIHAYPPQMPDELDLNVGDIICLALYFDDGWALGYNVTSGQKGAFPLVCISPAPKDSLDQLLQIESLQTTVIDSNNTKNDTLSLQVAMNKIRSSVRRSPSSHSYKNHTSSIHSSNAFKNNIINHHIIPKRSASYESVDYFEVDSPSSPALHNSFFDVNVTPTK